MEPIPDPDERCQLDGIRWADHQAGFNHEFSRDGQLRPLKMEEKAPTPVIRILFDVPLRAALIKKGVLTLEELTEQDGQLRDSANRADSSKN